eukprot:TRINITY_DN20384_c0_g1_i1.p1 TRINITY_DN20384_c0_g1~~TRINITY_DN20384_c0_g1_i1.p1  ORF type:complete len:339 (+),score=77.30 TRINITY_DN20384_c0_g1_i1:87-1103(+)
MNVALPLSNITNLHHDPSCTPDTELVELTSVIKLKRDNYSVALRKQRNSEVLEAKRKKWNLEKSKDIPTTKGMTSSQIQAFFQNLKDKLLKEMHGSDVQEIERLLREFRRSLSEDDKGPDKECLVSGVVPLMVECLQPSHSEQFDLQYEAAWCLLNLASGDTEDIKYLIKEGVLQALLALLDHPNDMMVEQVIWGLANITGDTHDLRLMLIKEGIVEKILHVNTSKQRKIPVIRVTAWLMSNLVRGKPFPLYETVKALQPLMIAFLEIEDDDVLADTLWAISHMCDGPDAQIEDMTDHENFTERLCALLHSENPHVRLPAMRAVANCLTTEDLSLIHI